MTTRDIPFPHGTPCWVDLTSSDMDRSTAFYTGLFGWSIESSGEEFGGYVVYSIDGYTVAGQGPKMESMQGPDAWTTYISSTDATATAAAAETGGAQILAPAMQVGDAGTLALLLDPAGAAFGVWEAREHKGFGRYNEPGSVTWDEHHSKDFRATTAFYSSLFNWEIEVTSDTADFRYYLAKIDGAPVAGLMDSAAFLPPEVPSHWAVYFSVADADESIVKAVELGATVNRPAEDTAFGRIADLSDPTGASFKLHQVLPEDAAGT